MTRAGVRRQLPVILAGALAAVVAGARSLVAVSEWLACLDRDALSALGIGYRRSQRSGAHWQPSTATDLDRRMGAWMATRAGDLQDRRVIAIDGKSMRGATTNAVMHLLAALDHRHSRQRQ